MLKETDSGLNPGTILKLSGSYWEAFTLHAAVALDVFTIIGRENITAADLSLTLKADERSLARLLNALTAMDLLVKRGKTYSNTQESADFLSKTSPHYIGYMIMHHKHLAESWSHLDKAILTGKPVRARSSEDEHHRESFLMGMFNNATGIAPMVLEHIDLSRSRRLLDLGGGPGTYAIFFCRSYPLLQATVFDLPTTRPFAEKTISNFGLSGRINFQEGNYLEDDIAGTYDVAWLSHILHGEGPADCRNIINKAVSRLETGGMIMIHEFILDDNLATPLFPALFSLNMLLGTNHGQAYSEGQISAMLSEAGVKQIQCLAFQGPSASGIIQGIVA